MYTFLVIFPVFRLLTLHTSFSTMEQDFLKADSTNLPKVDVIMVANFFATNSDFCATEFRNIKNFVSSRQSYGDDAIGYVQLRRDTNLCTAKCKICPEHKVRSKLYNVTMIINEEEGKVISVECNDCPASSGGCKHAVAFLMWAHRRSEEPSTTSKECYWKKSKLAQVGTTIKIIKTKDLFKSTLHDTLVSDQMQYDILPEFLSEAKKRKLTNCQLLKHQTNYDLEEVNKLSMHYLIYKYGDVPDCDKFLCSVSNISTKSIIQMVEKQTRDQCKSHLWFELRYARITASRAYEVSRCNTIDGTLMANILGAKTPDTKAMKRGRILEESVKKSVEKKICKRIHSCGLFVSEKYPFIAASPDGIVDKISTIEIKCPTSEKTFKNYIKNDKITEKCMAQVQLQMFVTNLSKCYFCVADWDFEKNGEVKIFIIEYDRKYVSNILIPISLFWKNNVFPILYKSMK